MKLIWLSFHKKWFSKSISVRWRGVATLWRDGQTSASQDSSNENRTRNGIKQDHDKKSYATYTPTIIVKPFPLIHEQKTKWQT